MNAADGHHEIPGPTADDAGVAVPTKTRHPAPAASPLISPWTHCQPSAPSPSPRVDAGWLQFLAAGIAAR